MNDEDYTKIEISTDPEKRRMAGHATHGMTPFDVPIISHIEGNLYTGGCADNLVLPSYIEHVVSLYPWERYTHNHDVKSFKAFKAYDDDIEHLKDSIDPIVRHAIACVRDGKTLIHCQAGLNRSGLIAACVLIILGRTPRQAIDLLREKRSPAVLCNKSFENWLLSLK